MQAIKQLLDLSKKKRLEDRWLKRVHHVLMREYGWIPLKEFEELPIPMVFDLLDEIEYDQEHAKDGVNK